MQIHLVDATYELFRAHYAPRPPVLGRDGVVLPGVSGLCDQLLYLLREEGATHVGCATDRVIESFRNDLFPRLQVVGRDGTGAPRPVPDRRGRRSRRSGVVLWPMVEFEADDAIAAAGAVRRTIRRSSRSSSARPTRTWPNASSTSGSSSATDAARITYDRAGRDREVGRRAGARSRIGLPSSATRRTAIRGCPAGARNRPPRSCDATARSTTIPARAGEWDVRGVSGGVRLAAVLNDQREDALLYRTLARLRLDTPIPQRARDGARVARCAARRVGGVLRPSGPRPPSSPAASLAR